MSGPAECAGLFPLSPAFFPLVLAFLVAIACWFHCFPGFLLVFFYFFKSPVLVFLFQSFFCFFFCAFFFFRRFFLFFLFFFRFFFKTGLQELACIADNINIGWFSVKPPSSIV